MTRDFAKDFAGPVIADLNKKNAIRVGIALDCAILFGVLEYIDGNESLKINRDVLQRSYDEKVARLK